MASNEWGYPFRISPLACWGSPKPRTVHSASSRTRLTAWLFPLPTVASSCTFAQEEESLSGFFSYRTGWKKMRRFIQDESRSATLRGKIIVFLCPTFSMGHSACKWVDYNNLPAQLPGIVDGCPGSASLHSIIDS